MQKFSARFFLGANSKSGFSSLYDSFTDPAAGDFLWVLKGGPGCGKSTFMKRIGAAAEDAGEAVEYIHCSGDPDSLDAVYLPEKRVAYVDGTAPHVVEAVYPGAASLYLDLGAFFDAGALAPHLKEISELNRQYKALYGEAYSLLSAGAALLPKNMPGLYDSAVPEKIDKKADALAARELHRLHKTGRQRRRFLSAWSCKGHLTFAETLSTAARRIYAADNELGLGHRFLSRLADAADALGYDTILCPDPLEPEKPEALILPEASLAFLAADRHSGDLPAGSRHLRLDALVEISDRTMLRCRRRESDLLLRAASESLSRAKSLHDELEAVYRPHVDFSGLDRLTEDHIDWLFG